MVQKLILIGAFVLGSFATADNSNYTTTCGSQTTPVKFNYCISKPTTHASSDIIFYLHGLSESEKTWSGLGGWQEQVRTRWSGTHTALPTVIAVSFGGLWALADKNTGPFSGLLPAFTGYVIPQLEKAAGGLHGRRIIVGQSMGGFNTVQASLKTSKMFSKAAILCAEMADVSPFESDADLMKFLQTTAAWKAHTSDESSVEGAFSSVIEYARTIFPSVAEWSAANPLDVANRAKPAGSPELYVSTGIEDEYASYEGNVLFVSRLKKAGLNVEWEPVHGGHCSMNVSALADFLVK